MMITTRVHRLTRINQGYKQFNKNNISFSKSYDLSQNFILLHRFLQSTVIGKKTSSIIEYTKISTHISDERYITQSTSTIGSSQKTGKFKQ